MRIKVIRPDGAEVAEYKGAVPRVGETIRTFWSTSMFTNTKDLFRVTSVMYDAEDETAIVSVADSEAVVEFK